MKGKTNELSTCLLRSGVGICLAILLLLMGPTVLAQGTTGNIVGAVTDQSGAAIPGVTITVIHEETGARRTLITNDVGQYTANLLPIGRYTVEAEQSGFKKAKVSGILLEVNQTVRIDLAMEVGEISETVEVTSEIPLVKTDRSDVGAVIESKKVVELPLNGRNFLQLATLAPGTISVAKVDGVLASFQGGIIANGASSNANQITLDSIENQDWLVPRVGVRPSPDAIAEFKVMTATYSAEYGRGAGANINVVIKSGTNDFHGGVFWFHRNDNLDARNFFDPPRSVRPLPEFKRNQYGFTLGGPIIRNKTFFFGSFEGLRNRRGLTAVTIMPTEAQRAGDLSSGSPIFDPLTTRTDPATGRIIRDPFPGNVIPPNRISPQSQKVLELLYPRAQNQIPNQPNTVFNPVEREDQDQFITRIDHNLNSRATLWGRYALNDNPRLLPQFFNAGIPGQGTNFSFKQQNLVIGYNQIFRPTVVNDFRVGFNRYVQILLTETNDRDIVGEIGIEGTLRDRKTWGPPNITITGITAVGAFQFAPSTPTVNTFQFMDTLAITKGKHNIKVGADIKRTQQNGIQFPTPRGTYNFTGGFTRNPASPTGTGQGFADFLLGFPTNTSVILGKTDNDIRLLNAGFYFQDDWAVHRDVTLNLGVRYNYMPWAISARDRIVVWSEEHQAIILAQNNLDSPTTAAGFEGRPLRDLINDFKGIFNFRTRAEVGYPKALVKSDNNNIEPRIGIAWRMFGSNNTILRGGFGRFYEIVAGNIHWNMSSQPPYSRTLSFLADINALPTLTLARPFPATGVLGAVGVGGSPLFNWEDPYQDNWNVTLQRRLIKNTSLEVAYIGARGIGQRAGVDWNAPVFGTGPIQPRRPHPERGGSSNDVPWGRRWYNSMQVKLESRTNTLSLLASYTLAKFLTVGGGGINEAGSGLSRLSWNFFGFRPAVTQKRLDPDDPFLALDKGPTPIDIRHRLSVAYVWELPFGQGRRFGLPGPINWILGGWELSGVTTFESGTPVDVVYGIDNLGGAGTTRPNLIGNPNKGPKTPEQWFDKSAFSAPAPITEVIANKLDPLLAAGNAGRGVIVGPGVKNWDIGVYKNFRIKEGYRIQFRMEMFNAFNNVNFGNPVTTFLSPSFGRIFSAGDARQIQFGLKFDF